MKHSVLSAVMLTCGAVGFAGAADYTAGNIVVMDPWVRAMAPAAKVGGGYFSFSNHAGAPDRLVAVHSDVSDRIEIHEMHIENNVMKMRKLAGGLKIAAHDTVVLQPGGYHVMFFNPHKPFREGEHFKASLEFEKAGRLEVTFDVKDMEGKTVPRAGHEMQNYHR